MTDGLYRVVYKGLCAGFVVINGKVVACAPALRGRIEFWKSIATRVP